MDSVWKQWEAFVRVIAKSEPLFFLDKGWPEPAQLLYEDFLLGEFAAAQMAKGNKAKTAANYVILIRSKHALLTGRKLGCAGWGESVGTVSRILKGFANWKPDDTEKRLAVTIEYLCCWADSLPSNSFTRALKASVDTEWNGLLRNSEANPKSRDSWAEDEKKLSRGSLRWAPSFENPTHLAIKLGVVKNDSAWRKKTGNGAELLLPFHFPQPGQINAAYSIKMMILGDPLRGTEKPEDVPLFRYGDDCIKQSDVSKAIVDMMELCRLGGLWDGKGKILAHSLRIGGATALFDAGCPEMVIRIAGRWTSDCYELYVRNAERQLCGWISRMVPRGVRTARLRPSFECSDISA